MNRITHQEACSQIRATLSDYTIDFMDADYFTITTRVYLDADRLTCVCLPTLAKKDYQTTKVLSASITRFKHALSESLLWLDAGRIG